MNNFKFTYIIDDDAIFVLVFKKILSNIENFEKINSVKNGKIALYELIKMNENNEKLPDIIFLDLNMPVLDGWQFLDEIENLTFKDKLNIHVISSTIDSKEIDKSKRYKTVKSFIQKPTSAQQLIESLEIV
ncbi:MAG: response regulator [Flavobacterium sp.]|nr:response regulator [Flavobacterium sp.]